MNVRTYACAAAAGLAAACASTGRDDVGLNTPVDAVVPAAAETVRVAGSGDAADDPAIWIAENAADSLVIGTDKTAGLYSFTLDGEVKQFLEAGRLNNVDLRPNFSIGGDRHVLIAASNRTDIGVSLFILNPKTGDITQPEGGFVTVDVSEPYGLCMADLDSDMHVFLNSKDGEVVELLVSQDGDGVQAQELNRYQVPSQPEGCVIDDRNGVFYLGEEAGGVWRFDTWSLNPTEGELVIPVDGETLVEDLEGLALYPDGAEGGWLVASSQGDSAFVFYTLPNLDYAGRIRIGESESGVDAVTGADGIDVTNAALPGYPEGVLIVQDDVEDTGGQNFKLIGWAEIADAITLR